MYCCINVSFGAPGKKISANFIKAKTKFCLGVHYNNDNSQLFINRKKSSLNFKKKIVKI